jgi:2-polyprenyl-3-methyl-5-hydroxy-6-metoxy-1,4-benzoquinol methylase
VSIEKEVSDFYDQIAKDYQKKRFSHPYYRKVASLEEEYVSRRVVPGSRVLEIGPGTGRFTRLLVEKAARVDVVDISQEMLAEVRQRVGSDRINTINKSVYLIDDLDLYGDYDLALGMRVLPHLEEPQKALTVLAGAVKPGGDVIFDFWNRFSYVGLVRTIFRRRSMVYTRYFTHREITKMIAGAGLEIQDSVTWGFPRLGSISMDFLGNKFLKPLGYSQIFTARSVKKTI